MKLTLRRLTMLVVTAACWLLSAPAAEAVIQVQRGISGIAVGMSLGQVKSGLGTPWKTKKGTNDFGPFTQYVYRGGLTVSFQGNQGVTAVSITGLTDRTARDVGVGSTEKIVKKNVPGVKCETIVGVRSCHVGTFEAGRLITDFLLRNGRVTRVVVGIVID